MCPRRGSSRHYGSQRGGAPRGRRPSASLLVRLANVGGDTASFTDLVSLLPGPFADLRSVLAAGGRRRTSRAPATFSTALDAPTALHIGRQGFHERAVVLVVQVDLV